MKKILFLSALLLAGMSVFAQSGEQFQNPGFESWETVNSYQEPTHWNGFPSANATGGYAVAKNGDQLAASTDVRPGSTGSKSAKISAKSLLGVVANGNLTNGRINGASIKATDADNNYNYMDASESDDYKFPFTSHPDSLVVWVKFVPSNNSATANISCYLFDGTRYQTPTSSYKGTEIGKAYQDIPASSSWTRVAIPFTYNNTNTPAYALFTATTNTTPGSGTAGDYMLLDDIELIYNPAPVTTYTVSVADMQNGSVVASSTSAAAGAEITLTVTPAEGYELETLSVKDANGADVALSADHKFTMPESNVTVSATFKKHAYKVSASNSKGQNGKVTVDKTTAYMGDIVQVTATASAGYELDKIQVTKISGSSVAVDADNKFTMPAEDVKVTATFMQQGDTTKTYTVTVSDLQHGSVVADSTVALAGSIITLTVTPAEGYELETLSVKDANGADVALSADHKFTMPESDVTVSASFKLIESALNDVEAQAKAVKFLHNGRLYILKNDHTYTVSGILVK